MKTELTKTVSYTVASTTQSIDTYNRVQESSYLAKKRITASGLSHRDQRPLGSSEVLHSMESLKDTRSGYLVLKNRALLSANYREADRVRTVLSLAETLQCPLRSSITS